MRVIELCSLPTNPLSERSTISKFRFSRVQQQPDVTFNPTIKILRLIDTRIIGILSTKFLTYRSIIPIII